MDAATRLEELAAEAAGCRDCPLWQDATQALFGSKFRIKHAEGAVLEFEGHPLVATLHPSAVLRARSSEDRSDAFDRLVGDLRRAAAIGR
jgi:DNA polymerase